LEKDGVRLKTATKEEQERKVHEASAFLAGYKPALNIRPNFKYFDYLLDHYPFIDEKDIHQNYIFFQTADLKKEFVERTHNVEHHAMNPSYARELGLALGFPKKSVEYFVECLIKEKEDIPRKVLHRGRIGIWYAGFSFATHIDLLVNEVHWLWNTYDHPFARECLSFVEAGIDAVYRLDYGDEKRLCQLEEHIRNKLGLIPIV
jgi:hypothetical protein